MISEVGRGAAGLSVCPVRQLYKRLGLESDDSSLTLEARCPVLCPFGRPDPISSPLFGLSNAPAHTAAACSASVDTSATPMCGHPWPPNILRVRCCPLPHPARRTCAPMCAAVRQRHSSSPSRSASCTCRHRRSSCCARCPRLRSSRREHITHLRPMWRAAPPAARQVGHLCPPRARHSGRPSAGSGRRRG